MAAFAPARRPVPALSLLFARYVAGQIAEAQWAPIVAVLDAAEARPEERAAFANYCLDALAEGDEVIVPAPADLRETLAIARA